MGLRQRAARRDAVKASKVLMGAHIVQTGALHTVTDRDTLICPVLQKH